MKSRKVGKIEQGMQQTRISKVYLRCLDLALAEIFMPRLKLPDHKSSGQNVKIGAHGFIRQVKGTDEFGGIPGLTVIMSQHRPETTHGRGRDRNAKLGDISGQEGLNEAFAPREAVVFGGGKKRTRKPASLHPG
jgi:hypothetical protein